MGLWDLSFKVLSRARPHDLLGLVPGIDPSRSLRLIDKEFEPRLPLPRALDACLEYEDERGEGMVFQLEFESEPTSDSGRRVFEHAALAHLTLKRVVRPVVLYLTPGKEGRRPHDSYQWSANGRAVLRFRFEKVCLWEQSAEAIGARTLGRGRALSRRPAGARGTRLPPDRTGGGGPGRQAGYPGRALLACGDAVRKHRFDGDSAEGGPDEVLHL